MSNNNTFSQERRQFLGELALLLAPMVLPALPRCAAVRVAKDRYSAFNEERAQKKKEYQDTLNSLDSAIGIDDLENIFQIEYSKGSHSPRLKVRSAPNVAQLPYQQIVDALRISEVQPLVVLYPGGGDDIAPVLFAHILHSNFPDIPVKMIYTEINDAYSENFRRQLGVLREAGVLNFEREERKTDELTTIDFIISTKTGKFRVEYRIRAQSKDYFTQEDADEANLFRENYTFDGTNNQEFIAEMAVRGYKKHKPILIIFPDYDGLGNYYTRMLGQEFDYRTNTYTLPQRLIRKQELVALEEEKGPRNGFGLMGYQSDKPSLARPIRDVPGDIVLSRGYLSCSCRECLQRSVSENSHEIQRYNYSVLWQPTHLEDVAQDKLAALLNAAFKTMPEIYMW